MRDTRPASSEFAPYYEGYVSLIADGDIVRTIEQQCAEIIAAFTNEPGRALPGKWSVKDVLLHVTDTERIMAYRALRIARGDSTPLAGFDQDPYAEKAGAESRSLEDLLHEFRSVRAATVTLLGGLSDEAWDRVGSANGNDVSVRALAWIIAGHAQHHAKAL